jgi:hypothetical protein
MNYDLKQLANEEHGAIQVDQAMPDHPPLIVMIAGPICQWWKEWDSPRHRAYLEWRSAVVAAVIKAGHLVYLPHAAIRGSWHPRAQRINDGAIICADVVVSLRSDGDVAIGTDSEESLAATSGVPVLQAPPGTAEELEWLLLYLASLRRERRARGWRRLWALARLPFRWLA